MHDQRRCWCWIITVLVTVACSPKQYLRKELQRAEIEFKDHIGFVLYDPEQKKTILDYQGDRYFTPASNTKIFTFFASIQLLGDSIPALRYVERNDSLIFWGTGDPSFLYSNVCPSEKTYAFLKNYPSRIFFSSGNFHTELLGPGWAWGDYRYTYQVERSPFPIFGNRSAVKRNGNIFCSSPDVFQEVSGSQEISEESMLTRDQGSNRLTFVQGTKDRSSWEIPFHYNDELLVKMLSDTLKREVNTIVWPQPPEAKTIYSVASDSLYKVMLQESDNFIAEQLLLMCAGVLSDTLKPEIAIRFLKKDFLSDLPDEPAWADGSGLSRYNLFTPRSIVRLWEKILGKVPRERLFSLVAVGGESGTIRSYYKAEKPFIYGKTGSLSNNHSLSGFLVTKRGRTLIFSWMNNNFTVPASGIRSRMETVLKKISEDYH